MRDLLVELFFRFPIIPVAELAFMIVLSRRRVKLRFLWVLGSYLLCVVATLVIALVARDEFGFSFIPLILSTAFWQSMGIRLRDSAFTGDMAQIVLGVLLNCAIFYAVGRLSYPRQAMTAAN